MASNPDPNDPNAIYCTYCLRKQPPVYTKLIPGQNTYQHWLDQSKKVCFDCSKDIGAKYRGNKKAVHNAYRQKKKDETIEKFDSEWNKEQAKAFEKDLVEKLLYVFDHNDRRHPALGIEKTLACQVIFKDWWFIKPSTVVEDYFEETEMTQAKQNDREQILLEFVIHNLELLQEIYRIKAINKYNAAINALNRRYRGVHKLVATPEYMDPITGDSIRNWFLLSRQEDKDLRDIVKDKVHKTIEEGKQLEQKIIDRLEEQKYVAPEPDKDDDTDDAEEKEGGQ